MSIKASQFAGNWTMTRIITKKIKVLHFGPLGGDPPATIKEFPYHEVIIGYVAGSEIIVSTRQILHYVTNEQSTTQRNVHFVCWMNGSTSDLWWIAELWYSDEFKLELTPVWCKKWTLVITQETIYIEITFIYINGKCLFKRYIETK